MSLSYITAVKEHRLLLRDGGQVEKAGETKKGRNPEELAQLQSTHDDLLRREKEAVTGNVKDKLLAQRVKIGAELREHAMHKSFDDWLSKQFEGSTLHSDYRFEMAVTQEFLPGDHDGSEVAVITLVHGEGKSGTRRSVTLAPMEMGPGTILNYSGQDYELVNMPDAKKLVVFTNDRFLKAIEKNQTLKDWILDIKAVQGADSEV